MLLVNELAKREKWLFYVYIGLLRFTSEEHVTIDRINVIKAMNHQF